MTAWYAWRRAALAASLTALAASRPLLASELDVHVGPPSLGNGGTNPVSIPPINPVEYEVEYITNNDYETSIGIVPGLFFGKRHRMPLGLYFGTGGGLVLEANGVGPGVYASVGFNAGKSVKFNVEFKQAIGYNLARAGLISPYALRLGVGFEL